MGPTPPRCWCRLAAPVINTPPTVYQTPADGATIEGEPVSFSAVVNDAGVMASGLMVTWTSSIDGVLTGAVPDAAGSVSFSEPAMTVGTHIVTVTVSDTEGLTGMDMAVLNIDSAAEEEEEEDFLEEGDELPPELEGGTYSGCEDFDLDNLVIFGAIDAAFFVPRLRRGGQRQDRLLARTTSTSTASMSSMASSRSICAAPTPSISPVSGASGRARISTTTTTPKSST